MVEKQRRIWFVGNVKLHLDKVGGLGEFLEIEAIDNDGSIGLEKLKAQCFEFTLLFDVQEKDYVDVSYSDLLELV